MGNAFTSLVTTAVLLAGAVVSLPLSAPLPARAQATSIEAQAAPTTSLDNTSWKLVSWRSNTSPVVLLPQTTLTANFLNGRVSGSAGCNNYTARFQVNGSQLTIGPAASTRKACPAPLMRQENRFLNALNGAQQFSLTPQEQLTISYRTADGRGSLVFAPVSTATTSWLDRSKPVNWNKPGMAVPTAPAGQGSEANLGRCGGTLRPATAPEDQALTKAGWRLFGPYQRFGNTVLVQGLVGFDGMCRPMSYQGFVFVNGQFAGTLAPQPMDARTDGSSQPVTLFGASQINASFSRYTASDPLCCPSSTSFVAYELQRQGGRPLLVPMTVTSSPNKP